MVFACCFGGGGHHVVERQHVYAEQGKTEKAPFSELQGANKTGSTFLSGNTNTTILSTTTDSAATQYLNSLNGALASLSGSWYDRISSAVDRLVSVSGAALCSVSILDGTHERFTVVQVAGKHAALLSATPPGSQLLALQAAVPSATPTTGGGLRYNSLQVMQLLQAPFLYSFWDPSHASLENNQPPHDWQALHDEQGLWDFCALPLSHNKAVVGAVTLAFVADGGVKQQPRQLRQEPRTTGPGSAAPRAGSPLMACDEQSMRTLGYLLSVLLIGQDMQLAQQVAEALADVHNARNLQQVISAVTGGAEQVLRLTTRVMVATNAAVLVAPASASAASTAPAPGAAGAAGNGTAPSSTGGGGGGRAIFFEERNGSSGSRADGSVNGALRTGPSFTDVHGATQGLGASGRSRLQRANTETTGGGAAAGSNPPGQRSRAASNLLNSRNGNTSSSQDSSAAASQNGLLWQQGQVQARILGLRHTLLANLPSTGTVVQDCASYMQQVGCPKRDLYLLSTCQGAPPFSLVIVPAPLREGDTNQLVLYVAVATKLPMEFLSEILGQAQQLVTHVLAPVLQRRLLSASLAEEWALLLGKCTGGRGGAAAAATGASASGADSRTIAAATAGGSQHGGTAGIAGGGNGSIEPGGRDAAYNGAIITIDNSPGNSEYNPTPPGAFGAGASATQNSTRGRSGTLPNAPASPTANGSQLPPSLDVSRAGTTQTTSGAPGGSRLLAGMSPQASQATVLSTALGGAFAGDTRTHMAMLVSSFKETISSLQSFRAEEAEELSVLKLGKVLGRGGSGLVFQGYLHLGLEVAVKLFENPDDTDPDAMSGDGSHTHARALDGSSNGKDAAANGEAAGAPDAPTDGAKDGASAGAGGGGGGSTAGGSKGGTAGGASKDKESSKDTSQARAAAQMTKRQRDLLRNALELGVTSSLSHPNIVQGYCHWVNVVLMQDASLNRCWLMGQAEYMALAPPGSPPPPLCSALVMEYCDMGSLIHALKRGTFTAPDGKPNMEFIYMCLLEIALALRHLHTARLAHCDLKPGNVLLRSSPRDQRSFVCKLGDFGYAAILKDGLLPGRPAVLPDEACGTLQYMAPELFVAGRPVDASIDIYAFGMLMWELITGKTPYSDNDYGSRALMKAVYHGKRPTFPENTLPAYKNLAMCCWSGDPTSRPSAVVLVRLLRNQLESLKHSGSGSSGSGSRA